MGARIVTTPLNRTSPPALPHPHPASYPLTRLRTPLRVGIGILAHNEEKNLPATLQSLSQQELLQHAHPQHLSVEVCIVANGCTDRTTAIAEEALTQFLTPLPGVLSKVASLPTPGKSHAWNAYVHALAPPEAEFLILMDADIRLLGAQTLSLLLQGLQETPHADVSVDTILKDLLFRPKRTLRDTLSLRISELSQSGPPKIAGSLYAIRNAVARTLWLPIGLLVEDGFLKALVTTHQFTRPEDPHRILRVPNAAHCFTPNHRLSSLLKHEKRLLLGTTQNILLFQNLRASLTQDPSLSVSALIQRQNTQHANWVHTLTRSEFQKRGWRTLPFESITLPFRQIGKTSWPRLLRGLPFCLIRSIFNTLALLGTYRDLRRGRILW